MLEINLFWPTVILIAIAALFLFKELIYKALRNKIEAEIIKKDIHNIDKWSKVTSESLLLNLSKNPEDWQENMEKIENFSREIANYIGRKEAGDTLSLKILERLDEIKKMQGK